MARDSNDRGDEVIREVEVVEVVEEQPVVVVTPDPAVAPGDVIEEDVVPGRVIERERVEQLEDGSVERRLDRVEQGPVRRRHRVFDWWPILLLVLALALGALAAAWYFTRAEDEPVTEVVGLQVDEAVTRLQADGFKTAITREPSSTEPEGIVLRQTPVGGTEVEEGSTVTLVAAAAPETVAVPNAVGVTEQEARDRLADAGLTVSVVEVFSQEPDGTVVAQNPAAGLEVEPGSSVRLNVSKGEGSVAVPTVVGQQAADAQQVLTQAGFEVNIVDVPSIEPAGVVVAQNPRSGDAPAGSSVRLNVSNGELPG